MYTEIFHFSKYHSGKRKLDETRETREDLQAAGRGYRQGHRAQCAPGQKECDGGVSRIVQQSRTSGMLCSSENV